MGPPLVLPTATRIPETGAWNDQGLKSFGDNRYVLSGYVKNPFGQSVENMVMKIILLDADSAIVGEHEMVVPDSDMNPSELRSYDIEVVMVEDFARYEIEVKYYSGDVSDAALCSTLTGCPN